MHEYMTWLLLAALVVVAQSAWAHRYIPNDGSHVDAASALDVGDVDISTVVYHTLEDGNSQLWLRFDAKAGQTASIEVGVPYIERFQSYRPAFALLGPGMAPIEVPFPVPEGYGGILYTTGHIESPELFNEVFTGTKSWVFERQAIKLPETGRYYIVGFTPSGDPGKFWVAPGTRESFSLCDILSLPCVIYQVRTFHEVFPFGGLLAWGILAIVVIIILVVVL